MRVPTGRRISTSRPTESGSSSRASSPTNERLIRVVVRRVALLRRAAELVVLALGAPRVGVEALHASVRLDLAMRAELLVAVFGRLHPSAGAEADPRGRRGTIRGG